MLACGFKLLCFYYVLTYCFAFFTRCLFSLRYFVQIYQIDYFTQFVPLSFPFCISFAFYLSHWLNIRSFSYPPPVRNSTPVYQRLSHFTIRRNLPHQCVRLSFLKKIFNKNCILFGVRFITKLQQFLRRKKKTLYSKRYSYYTIRTASCQVFFLYYWCLGSARQYSSFLPQNTVDFHKALWYNNHKFQRGPKDE